MPRPRRIALCITSLGIGGAERCLTNLVLRLPREQFECRVDVLQSRPPEDQCELVHLLEAAEVPLLFHDARRTWDGPRLIRQLSATWREFQPELVQSMMFHANVAAALAVRRASISLHVTGIRAAERTARWRAKLERAFVHTTARHVCVSESVAEYANSVGGLPREKLVVIPNGVNLARFAGIEPAEDIPPRSIVFVGRFDEQKNVVALVQQAHHFLDRLPGYQLLLVGDGEQRAEVEGASRDSRIVSTDIRSDIPAILKRSELLVLPSNWEGMPNVVLEAMTAGLPVVSTDVEGVRELLGPRAEEQIVPIGDMPALADRIVAILSQPKLAASLGRDNGARGAVEFSVEKMVERYIALYDTLLAD